jgi:hypothetical protein
MISGAIGGMKIGRGNRDSFYYVEELTLIKASQL